MRTPDCGDAYVGFHVLAADEIDGDVDRPCGRGDLVGERDRIELARREHRVIEAEGAALLELVERAGGTDHGAAERVGKLHRGGSDARARGVHEHCLAPCDAAPA